MQMESLSHNWRDVFSPHVYFKVIGKNKKAKTLTLISDKYT